MKKIGINIVLIIIAVAIVSFLIGYYYSQSKWLDIYASQNIDDSSVVLRSYITPLKYLREENNQAAIIELEKSVNAYLIGLSFSIDSEVINDNEDLKEALILISEYKNKYKSSYANAKGQEAIDKTLSFVRNDN